MFCYGAQVPSELDQIALRLQEAGLASSASAEECQRHLWRQLLHCEGDLRTATQELHTLRTQQATEMKEVRQTLAQQTPHSNYYELTWDQQFPPHLSH